MCVSVWEITSIINDNKFGKTSVKHNVHAVGLPASFIAMANSQIPIYRSVNPRFLTGKCFSCSPCLPAIRVKAFSDNLKEDSSFVYVLLARSVAIHACPPFARVLHVNAFYIRFI